MKRYLWVVRSSHAISRQKTTDLRTAHYATNTEIDISCDARDASEAVPVLTTRRYVTEPPIPRSTQRASALRVGVFGSSLGPTLVASAQDPVHRTSIPIRAAIPRTNQPIDSGALAFLVPIKESAVPERVDCTASCARCRGLGAIRSQLLGRETTNRRNTPDFAAVARIVPRRSCPMTRSRTRQGVDTGRAEEIRTAVFRRPGNAV